MDQDGLKLDREALNSKVILTEGECQQFKRLERKEKEIAVLKYNDLQKTVADERIMMKVISDRQEEDIRKIKDENDKIKNELKKF